MQANEAATWTPYREPKPDKFATATVAICSGGQSAAEAAGCHADDVRCSSHTTRPNHTNPSYFTHIGLQVSLYSEPTQTPGLGLCTFRLFVTFCHI